MKKGQAAMEFLMTYGWAILVVLIAIGALAYFGVLSPERFKPEYKTHWEYSVSQCIFKNSSITKIMCLNTAFNDLDIDDCKISAEFYKYSLDNLRIKNMRMFTDNHVFNIAYTDNFYCLIDMSYIQCVSVK